MSVLRNGPQSSMEIKDAVDKHLRKKLEQNWNEALERGDKDLSQKEEFISKYFHPPAFRTIQLILSQLLAEELVQVTHAKRKEKYSLTPLANDVRYWAKDLGATMLSTAAKHYYPTISTLKENVENLINMFGTYIVFCFMATSRRNPRLKLKVKIDEFNKRDDEERIEGLNHIDEVTLEALENMFDPQQMYRMFLATIKAQPTDDEIQETIQKRFEIVEDSGNGRTKRVYIDDEGRRASPPSIEDLAYKHFLVELKKKRHYRENFSTIYELKPNEIVSLAEALKKRYETVFLRMIVELSTVTGEKSL